MRTSVVINWLGALSVALTLQLGAFAANSAPVPTSPVLFTKQNTTATSQVSANDADAGDTETYAITINPSHGSAGISTAGLVTYTPAANYHGADSLQVTVTDNHGASGSTTVSIFVRGDLIPVSLPEHTRFNAGLVAACQSTITLKYPATVEAYFLDEGAGYHNTLAWYDVTAPSTIHEIWHDASSVYDLLGNTDGTLHTGDRVELGTFSGGETIGFYLHNITGLHHTMTSDPAANLDGLKHVLIMAIPDAPDLVLVTFEDKDYQSDYDYNDEMIILNIGAANVQNWIDTSTQPMQYIVPTKYANVTNDPTDSDYDGDGVPNSQDMFPLDPARAFIYSVPTPSATVVAYEDLFPAIGDYDFNDCVISYHVNYVTNGQNQLVEIRGDAKLLAHGAAASHDWHLRFIGSSFNATATITQTPGTSSGNTGSTRTVSSTASVDASKTEIDLPVIMDTKGSMPYSRGNTIPNLLKGDGDSATFLITFATPIDPATFDTAPFDPYLYVRDNGLDIHLPNKPLCKNSTNPPGARAFVNSEGMPWALHIPSNWQWPVEKVDIRTAYPNFTAWANSGGTQYTNWYNSPLSANVVQTPQSGDKWIWAGNQTPAAGKRSIERFAAPAGFDFATVTTRRLNLRSSQRVSVALLPLGANSADTLTQSVATFSMLGTTIRDVRVPAAWESCTAVITPENGNPWEVTIDWKGDTINLASTDPVATRMAVISCQIKIAPNSDKATILLTGGIDPSALNVTAATTGTLYIGGIAVPFGNGAAPIKVKMATAKSNAPWNAFTIKANVDITPWLSNGIRDNIVNRKTVALSVTLQSGGATFYGDATIVGK